MSPFVWQIVPNGSNLIGLRNEICKYVCMISLSLLSCQTFHLPNGFLTEQKLLFLSKMLVCNQPHATLKNFLVFFNDLKIL